MKKNYLVNGLEWIWNTETDRWISSRPTKTVPPETRASKVVAHEEKPGIPFHKGWKAVIHWLYVEYRTSPGWEQIKAPFELDDAQIMDRLETYYTAGKLKVKDDNHAKNAA